MGKSFLYILYSPSISQYYLGISHDPEKRLIYHNSARKGWTQRGRPWQLLFKKEWESRSDAIKWERKLKSLKRRDIIEIIVQNKFEWKD